MRAIARIYVLACLCVPRVAPAQSVAIPTTSPSTQPATLPSTTQSALPTTRAFAIDQSTPKAAVRTFALALDAGDADALRAVMSVTDDTEAAMVDSMVAMAVAYARFTRACVEQFGKAETDASLNDPDARRVDALQRVDQASANIQGDRATVGRPDEPPVILKRTPKGWQIVVGAVSPTTGTAEALAARISGIKRQVTVFETVTADIQSSRYRSMREVLTVVHGLMMKAAVESDDSATTVPANGAH